ncbi:MAG: DUF488 domain-containing protein [Bacteroidetes bacterium]|nr:DUF488 domain-containing protein [Bacteroidota bacterium]
MAREIKVKRIYEADSSKDGVRILVDRLWPRGIKKEDAKIDFWMKDIAPSNELRSWFSHDPEKWNEFTKKYFNELKKNKTLCEELLSESKDTITLLYSAKDEKHNQAVALKQFLEKNFG